jgi:LPXTG-site transpeptidase (sortase) family protein
VTLRSIFAAFGAILLCVSAAGILKEKTFQESQTAAFVQQMEHPAPQPARKQRAIARLTIPDLGIAAMVVNGVSNDDLRLGPGHIPGTALPGRSGNVGIAGHRDTVFRPLRSIRKDQVILLTTLHRQDRYRVVWTAIVSPKDTSALRRSIRDSLTLVTCYPFDFIGPAPKRFIVRAERVESMER